MYPSADKAFGGAMDTQGKRSSEKILLATGLSNIIYSQHLHGDSASLSNFCGGKHPQHQRTHAEEVTKAQFLESATQADGGFAKRNEEKDDAVREQSDAVSMDLMEDYDEGRSEGMTEQRPMPQIIEEETANHMDEAVRIAKLMKKPTMVQHEMTGLPHA